jgi:hypothetical protein
VPSNKKIKKEIKYGSLTIRLYEVKWENLDENIKSVANIQALDSLGNLLWTIQPPVYNTFYFDMQIDEDKGVLEADSGAGRVYEIDLNDGHILGSELRK